ncbi:hypothetical protein PPE_04502 [Paenibacillus polymyxa E681]|nr:hypothetical protein PPE_04502 [Paenibacillus polymyxa E681]
MKVDSKGIIRGLTGETGWSKETFQQTTELGYPFFFKCGQIVNILKSYCNVKIITL